MRCLRLSQTLALVGCVASAAGCTLEDAVDVIGDEIADCLDEDGCGDNTGTPLADWAPPLVQAGLAFGDDETLPDLTVVLFSRDPFPFCPERPVGLTALLNGVELTNAGHDFGPSCPVVVWHLGPEDWPTTSGPESVVEVTDGETTFTLPFPVSLTEPPGWDLGGVELVAGELATFPARSAEAWPPNITPEIHAGLGTPGGEYVELQGALVDDELQLQVPSDFEEGPIKLSVGYWWEQKVEPCAAEDCSTRVSGHFQFDVDVVAP